MAAPTAPGGGRSAPRTTPIKLLVLNSASGMPTIRRLARASRPTPCQAGDTPAQSGVSPKSRHPPPPSALGRGRRGGSGTGTGIAHAVADHLVMRVKLRQAAVGDVGNIVGRERRVDRRGRAVDVPAVLLVVDL